MTESLVHDLTSAIRDIPDFPKPGIVFKDITPILSNGPLFSRTVGGLAERCHALGASKIVGIDARGFIFGAAVADRTQLGFVPVRKAGKLPYQTERVSYTLEYGQATVEMHVDALQPGEKVVLIDDLLATGGTAEAALQLIRKLEADPVAALFLVELDFLKGRDRLESVPVESFVRVEG